MSRKIYMFALTFAGFVSLGSLGASQVAAFPTNAAAVKSAAPVTIVDVRGGRGGGGGFRGGGGGARVAGGGVRGGGRYAAGGGRYAGGGRVAGGYRGGYVAGGYRGGYGVRAPYWGAATVGAAAAGAAAAGSYYYGQQYGQPCGYAPYPPCY